jgi:hypothetical protein
MNSVAGVNQFSFEDTRHLTHAQGFIELRMYSDAETELLEISPSLRQHPDFLVTWWHVLFHKNLWKECVVVANQIIENDQNNAMAYIQLACALERFEGVENAYQVLRSVADRITDSLTINFNLACYACELGRLEEARQWLRRAFYEAVGTEYEGFYEWLAVQDLQLKPLWKEIPRTLKSQPPNLINNERRAHRQ